MGFFKSVGGFFKHSVRSIENTLGEGTRNFGHFVEDHALEVGLGAAIAVGAVAVVATGGAFAPIEAELIGAEVVAVGAVELGAVVGAEAAVGAVAGEVAVGAIGAEVLGGAAAAEAVTAAIPIGEAVAAEGIVGAEIVEAAAVPEELGVIQRLGAVGSRVGRTASILGNVVKAGATAVGIGATVADIVVGTKEASEEEKLSAKIGGFGKQLEKATSLIEKVQGEEATQLTQLTKDISDVAQAVQVVEAVTEKIQGIESAEKDAIDSLLENQQKDEAEVRHLDQDIQDLKQQEATDRINDQHFESKLVERVIQEERELEGVIDDLAERLEESELKPLDFSEFNSLLQRLETDDILDFLSRNEGDFKKLSNSQQDQLIDLAILKGL